MATYKPQIRTNSGVEDIEIDASTLSGKDSSHYLNYNNLTNKPTVPTKTSQLTNDSGFKTIDTDTWRTISVNGATIFGGATNTAGLNLQKGNNVTIEATAGSPNVTISATDTTYTFANGTNSFTVTPKGGTAQTVTVTPSIANATTSKAGLMSSADKTNLDTLSNLLGDDSDAVVNKINEVIEIFDTYPEGNKIADALAGKQSKVAKLGSASKPVYVSANGTFAEASTYAGGTKVTLNGTDKGASTASLYAPTTVGTSGQILKSNGSGAPTWVAQSSLSVGYASSAGSATAATTAKNATNDQLGNNIKDTYATKDETATARNIAAALNSANVVNADGHLDAKYDGDGNEITATYAKKEYAVYYVEGNTTGTAGAWTGTNSDIKSLYDGLVINYKIGISGANTTTLNINELGAKTVYLRGTTKATTQYAAGTMVLLSYNATTGAFYSADYDANPNTGTINATSLIVSQNIDANNIYAANDLGAVTAEIETLTTTDSLNTPSGYWDDTGIYIGPNDETSINSSLIQTPEVHTNYFEIDGAGMVCGYWDDAGIWIGENDELNISTSGIILPNTSGLHNNAYGDSIGFNDEGNVCFVNADRQIAISSDTLDGDLCFYKFPEYGGCVPVTETQGTSGQVLTSNGNGTYKWSSVSGGGGTSSFTLLDNISVDLVSQSPMEFDLDYDPYKELFVYISTQDNTYELSDNFGNRMVCEEVAVMHLNYMSEDEMLLGTMTSDTGVSKPFISSNLVFFAESGDSIALRVIIYGR